MINVKNVVDTNMEKLYIRTQESREKDKIIVKTYRVFLGEENNKIREELVSENKYKIK